MKMKNSNKTLGIRALGHEGVEINSAKLYKMKSHRVNGDQTDTTTMRRRGYRIGSKT